MIEYVLDLIDFLRGIRGPLLLRAITEFFSFGLYWASFILSNLSTLLTLAFQYYVKMLSPSNIPAPRSVIKLPQIDNPLRLYVIKKKYGIDTPAALFQLVKNYMTRSPELQDVGVFKMWFGPFVVVMITRPEPAEVLLRKTNLPKAWIYKAFDTEGLGSHLISSNGDVWKTHRRLLTPSFDYRICESVIPIMNEHSRDLVTAFEQVIISDNGIINDISLFLEHCTFDIFFETACGLSSKSNRPGYREANEAFIENLALIARRVSRPWFLFQPLFDMTAAGQRKTYLINLILKFIDEIQEERRQIVVKDMAKSKNGYSDTEHRMKKNFLDILITENINNPQQMTLPDVKSEMLIFLTAGFETSTTTLTWTFLLLGHHPEVQDRIIQEISDVLGDSDRDLTSEDIREMKYIEAVAKESMRLYPAGPTFARSVTYEDIEVPLGQTGKAATLPIGTTVIISPYFIHRSQPHWPDPEVFDPDRFLTNERRHPYSFIPFSAGPRNCIGQKFAMLLLVCIIAYFFKNFRIKTLIPMSEVKASPRTTLMTYGSNPVQILLRKKQKGNEKMQQKLNEQKESPPDIRNV